MSEVNYVVWEDKVGGSVKRKKTKASSYAYTVGRSGTWQTLIADEDKSLEIHRVTPVKVKEVTIPPKSIMVQSFDLRHALGFAMGSVSAGMPKSYKEPRVIRQVMFYPIADGEIQKNDVLGVVNILYSHTEYGRDVLEEAAADMVKDRYQFG